jgi:gamma-glutamyltranspeptidase/glutathione hydrolase
MGGHGQPQIDAAVLMRAFDLGLAPSEAVAAPRWLAWGLDPPSGERLVWTERDVPDAARSSLRAAGFTIREVEAGRDVGHAQFLAVGPRRFVAGTDPRADGGALAG